MRVLVFVSNYLPGYRGGGPIRTIQNMVENLGDEIEFLIVTRDRDLGADKPYDNVQIDTWNSVGQAKVFYTSSSVFTFGGIHKILMETPHDVLYLNSFLSPKATGIPLLLRWFGLYQSKPVVIAPRGEFSTGALQLKSVKKKLYIFIIKILGIYKNLLWQASSDSEYEDIRRTLGRRISSRIVVAPNLLPLISKDLLPTTHFRKPGPLRLVFLSRISPMKNLDSILRFLGKTRANLQLNIFGPLEDHDYWSTCQTYINTLSGNVSVQYSGEVTPDQVPYSFSKHDVFVFPTRGENFGHVIFESLSAGTSVILSDQTPWQSDVNGAVEILSLEKPDAWVAAIEKWSRFNDEQFADQRTAAINYARDYVAKSPAIEQNRALFFEAVKENEKNHVQK